MLIRYAAGSSGGRKAVAKIYTSDEHSINPELVDRNAVQIVDRLRNAGFETYIVGGAVRDLILQKVPKDFDIATEASPKQIKKMFWNSRIIGKRFKIVHIHIAGAIYEITTFRSKDTEGLDSRNNIYGTIYEDAFRRDFSVNALYYCPNKQQLIDFVDAMKDFKSRRIRSVIPLNVAFSEDPVRMIRGVKYSVITGFRLGWKLQHAVKNHAYELKRCSPSRMTEEVMKILHSGYSSEICRRLIDLKLFAYMLPAIYEVLHGGKNAVLMEAFISSLKKLDASILDAARNTRKVSKGTMIAALTEPFLLVPEEYENTFELFRDVFKQIKNIIQPITPPNADVEKAAVVIFRHEQISVPKHALRNQKKHIPQKAHAKRDESGPSGRQPRQKKRKEERTYKKNL